MSPAFLPPPFLSNEFHVITQKYKSSLKIPIFNEIRISQVSLKQFLGITAVISKKLRAIQKTPYFL